jgi:hypothetical protein
MTVMHLIDLLAPGAIDHSKCTQCAAAIGPHDMHSGVVPPLQLSDDGIVFQPRPEVFCTKCRPLRKDGLPSRESRQPHEGDPYALP